MRQIHLEAAHDRLYRHAKKQKDKLEKIRMVAREKETSRQKIRNGSVRSEREADELTNRLYCQSMSKQNEGKKRREEIVKKHKPRIQTPSKKISVEDATEIYDRGMIQKVKIEMKRESSSLTKDYVSPLLDPLVVDHTKPTTKTLSNKHTSSSRIRPRSRIRTPSPNVRKVEYNSASTSAGIRSNSAMTPKNRTPKFHQRSPSPAQAKASYQTRSRTPMSTPMAKRWSTPLRGVPQTRARSPTPAKRRYRQSE
jgi:hypothetical protein